MKKVRCEGCGQEREITEATEGLVTRYDCDEDEIVLECDVCEQPTIWVEQQTEKNLCQKQQDLDVEAMTDHEIRLTVRSWYNNDRANVTPLIEKIMEQRGHIQIVRLRWTVGTAAGGDQGRSVHLTVKQATEAADTLMRLRDAQYGRLIRYGEVVIDRSGGHLEAAWNRIMIKALLD